LGYLYASTHGRFGNDTDKAVRAFQKDNHLTVDGIIGKNTSAALLNAAAKLVTVPAPLQEITQYLTDCPGLPEDALMAINLDLQDENPRISVVQEALRWLYPFGLYVFGANLYTPTLAVQLPTPEYIDARAKAIPAYFTNGRQAWMKDQYAKAVASGRRIGCADCSGFIVGIWRLKGLVPATFDATAHGLYHSYCNAIKASALVPGDCVFRANASGHIVHTGLYVGAGYTLEAAGGAYGVQLSRVDDHIIINQMNGHVERHKAWTHFGRPKVYKQG
jgi:hypothetical protein